MKRPLIIFVNVIAFHLCWTVTIVGTSRTWWWAGPLLIGASAVMQTRHSRTPRREWLVIIAGAISGVALDALGVACGMFRFHGSAMQFAIIFAALWINFGTIVRPSLHWLWNRPLLAAMLGALAAPLNYWAAARLGAIAFIEPSWHGLIWVAGQYALLLPLWMVAAPRLTAAPAGTARRSIEPAMTPAEGTPAP